MAKLTITQIRKYTRETLEAEISVGKLYPRDVEFLGMEKDQDGLIRVRNKIKRPGSGYGVWITKYDPDTWRSGGSWQED